MLGKRISGSGLLVAAVMAGALAVPVVATAAGSTTTTTAAATSTSAAASTVAQPPVAATVTTTPGQPVAPGDFFIDPYQLKNTPVNGPEIIDNQGRVLWYHALPAGSGASNFQVQTYEGQKVLTYWQGTTGNPAFGAIVSIGIGQGEDVVMNSHYQVIATFKGVGDLKPDAHEFTLMPNGDALVSAYTSVPSQQFEVEYPGVASAGIGNITVTDSHALTVDLKTGKILMDWDALQHVPLLDSNSIPMSPDDYFHINSISLDPEGNYLIDGRNTWAMYDVNPMTGDINWQLGGHGSSFTLGKGVEFAWQHDPRFIGPDEISVFDDGDGYPGHTLPANEPNSRAEWIKLDMATKTATLVKQINQPAGQDEAWSQGSVQDLPDGNTVVGWGSAGTFSEYSPSGTLSLLGKLPTGPNVTVGPFTVANNWNSYRTYKFPWTGTPRGKPTVQATASGAGQWNIAAAWNGDTQVIRWTVRAGAKKTGLQVIDTVPWNGLSTSIPLSGSKYRYVAVVALGKSGPLKHGTSPVIALP